VFVLRKKTGSISDSIRPKDENRKFSWQCSSQGWNQKVLFVPRERKYYFWQCSS
jgi:hypothetical protein